MALTATLYRHWLELRSPLRIVAVPGGILLALADMVMLLNWGNDAALHVHGACSVLAALLAGITCGGSGVQTAALIPGHPSTVYTLTLPVPRFRVIWTRSLVGALAGAVVTAPVFLATVLFWAAAGSSLSIGAIVTTSLTCWLLVIATQAIFSVVLPLWSENASALAVTACFLAVVFSPTVRSSWSTGVTSIVPPVSPIFVATLAIIAVASLPLASLIATRRDF